MLQELARAGLDWEFLNDAGPSVAGKPCRKIGVSPNLFHGSRQGLWIFGGNK